MKFNLEKDEVYMANKVVIVTNIPAPYRVELFYYMQTHFSEYEFDVIYTSKTEDNRQWFLDKNKLINSIILHSKVIKMKGKLDNRYIHLPINIMTCLNKISPDIVIAFEYNLAALQCLLWCKIQNKSFIHLTDGTLYSERNIGKIQKLARKVIIKNADAFIASSSKAKEKLMAWGASEKEIFTSLLTVDVSQFEKMEKEVCPGRILYVGSMIKRKGLDLLIKALSYLDIEYNLRIVGNGTEDEISFLKKIAKKNNVYDKITWCGFKTGDSLIDEYRQAQIFVLPTREDCFGLVLLEAFCAKLPIVSSKYADGIYDIVVDGSNGYIVDPFNSKEFGRKLQNALIDKDITRCAEKISFDKFKFERVSEGYIQALGFVNTRKNGCK